MKVRIQAALVAVAALALVLIGSLAGGRGATSTYAADPTPTPVTTGNIPLIAINPAICVMLEGAAGLAVPAACDQFDLPNADAGHISLMTVESFSGNNDGVLEPDDFSSMDLDGNQVHQMDDWTGGGTSGQGSLWIIAFVSNRAPVTFQTNVGTFVPPLTPNVPGDPHPNSDAASQTWVCDNVVNGAPGVLEDADCGTGAGGTADGVVVARLRARFGDSIADIGPGTVTVRQSITNVATLAFNVVGEPRNVAFTTLESTIQNGITDLQADCNLPTDAAGFLEANSNPFKAIVLAKALDIDGNSVTGAIVNWTPSFGTDPVTKFKVFDGDTKSAGMAAPLTPTLDLGSFGFGAPNIICGTTNPGTVTVKAELSKTVVSGSNTLTLDPQGSDGVKTVDFKVVGEPASISAVADPAAINCDGTSTSTITATVLDAAGDPVATGNEVHFDVQVLGTANPVNAKTNDKGVVTSTITPLAVGATGVPVSVTIGDLATSVRIDCQAGGAPAGGGAPPPAGAAGGAAGGGTGVITGPNTGTGDALAGSGSGVSAWAYALLALGAVALSAGSMLAAARARNR